MTENKTANISLGGNLWRIANVDDRLSEQLVQRYNLSPVVARILALRGVSVDDVNNFLTPKISNLMPDPCVLKDMAKAAERIAEAVVQHQHIAIIGDYDVDGATSTSVMKLFLKSIGVEPDVHIPDRDEGYGPSLQAVDTFKANGADLLITLDCGTTAFEPLEHATSLGLDVIVLDHHEAEARLPKIYAVVNPKRLDEDNDYPYLAYMAAVGVVFMTVVAVNRALRQKNFYTAENPEPDLKKWLDLVALGTVCDVVPLKGLNRAYVAQGLKVMAARGNIGLTRLMDTVNLSEAPTAFHLGYVLGPRINACGRVGDAAFGNQLLCCDNDYQAQLLADKLNTFNAERKDIENHVLLSAIEQVEGTPQEYPIAFVYGNDWHQGVIGIVAGRLKERYHVPSFAMSIESDEVKGSARSVPQVDLGALVMAAKEKGLITKGGGHTMAAGFSLEQDKIEEFKHFVGEYVVAKIGTEAVVPELEIDAVLDVGGANAALADSLEQLEPFGAGNAEPKLMLHRVRIVKPTLIGVGHIRCILTSENGASIKAIAFRVGDNQIGNAMLARQTDKFDVVGVLKHDRWNGKQDAVQFIIEDIRPSYQEN
jgi:single-stranded-DNA-specific exonuclease